MNLDNSMRIAITGGIGSGKSYVCKRLSVLLGVQVYDCDKAAKRLMRTDATIIQQLTEAIGPDTYVDGELNKAAVARFLLESEQNTSIVNHIVHPAVANDFLASGMNWMECAILYESGFDRFVDRVICVTAPHETRLRRVMERDLITHEKAEEWMAKQMPQEKVRKRADFEIVNDGQKDIDEQIYNILQSLQQPPNTEQQILKTEQLTALKNKNMVQTILSIAGKPGLFRLVSRGKVNLIVEALDDTHKRMPAFATDRVTSLADIAIYTENDEVPLMNVLAAMRDKEQGKECEVNFKKASGKELRAYFAQVLPDFDQERVHDSDIRKLIQWYNILVKNGITDFEEDMKPTEGDNIDDRKEQ